MSSHEVRNDLIALIARYLQASSSQIVQSVAALMPGQDYRSLPEPLRNAPVCAHLTAAETLFPSQGNAVAIASKFRELLPVLHWTADYPQHPVLKDAFGHAVIAASDAIVMGCNMLAARTDYPAHWHPAEEIYIPLSGSGARYWQESIGTHKTGSPGDIILHGARELHAMSTLDHPVLNVWIQYGAEPGGPAFFG
ncbi:dimethylsulfonioproprionate lyase family protein [Roseibium aggregatum]|uniref:Dimethlysulfoniopropionate lyase n=1 Tax=Roseibium aggregatum TaxID=187304 RepID=A0A939J6J3_9HYPH|nr:dimethylsulfonioproprionate lyase family protein [Roseibium aggregatum]MBN9673797.1 hypothetical protein [Roseibium aggregatum]